MSAKHTPGPWIGGRESKTDLFPSVRTPSGETIACTVRSDADAALIAAAPTMAERLREAVWHLDDKCDCVHVSQCAEAIQALVREGARAAEGKS